MPRALQDEICPKLGVEEPLSSVVLAWVHLRQYLQQGDLRMLMQAKKYLKAHEDSADISREQENVPPHERAAQSNLDDSALQGSQSTIVLAAIKEQLLHGAKDAFVQCTPEQVPHLFDAVLFASKVPAGKRMQALESLFLASVDAELDRCWHSACNAAEESSTTGQTGDNNETGRTTEVAVFLFTARVCCLPASYCSSCVLLDFSCTAAVGIYLCTYVLVWPRFALRRLALFVCFVCRVCHCTWFCFRLAGLFISPVTLCSLNLCVRRRSKNVANFLHAARHLLRLGVQIIFVDIAISLSGLRAKKALWRVAMA
jgi:hypothetical protein